MTNMLLLVGCLFAGILLHSTRRVGDNAHQTLNAALGLLIDQLGSYLVLSTLGVLAATIYAAEARASMRAMAIKVATFPPLIAVIVALLLRPVSFPPLVDGVLIRLSDTLAPLALLSVGMQLRVATLRDHARSLGLGLSYKLVACPAIVVAVLWLGDADGGMTERVSVIEAAMPPMIGAGIVAAQAKLDVPLVSTMIGVGIPLGLSTSTAWHWLFGALAA